MSRTIPPLHQQSIPTLTIHSLHQQYIQILCSHLNQQFVPPYIISKSTTYSVPNHRYLASDSRPQEDPIGCKSARSDRKDANPQDYPQEPAISCYHIVFFVMPFVLSTGLKIISREDAHPIYPRYPRVFLFVCHDLLPTPTSEGLGVSLSSPKNR
jgi:hypothetical protein